LQAPCSRRGSSVVGSRVRSTSSGSRFVGPERLVDVVQGARCDEAPAVVKRCLDEVEAFAPDGLRDDATIVVVCRPDID
jgi:serine phosphatase RsbU (regulator of sigma subunit)